MILIPTPTLGRRRFLVGGLAAAGGLIAPVHALGQGAREPTPSATPGPYYPVTFPGDVDNDLVVVRGSEAKAGGVVTHIRGRVLDLAGKPLVNAQVEIWQCDINGFYLHPGSDGRGRRDSTFQGFGRTRTDANGAYSFRTIKPVAYSGRTPHIHFGVEAGKAELVTQMYLADEPLNARDGLYSRIRDPRARDAVTVRLDSANGIENGALAGTFDLVLKT